MNKKLIVTYSARYRNYQCKIRNSQIACAKKAIDDSSEIINKCDQNDYKRFLRKTSITTEGKVADEEIYSINTDLIQKKKHLTVFMVSVQT